MCVNFVARSCRQYRLNERKRERENGKNCFQIEQCVRGWAGLVVIANDWRVGLLAHLLLTNRGYPTAPVPLWPFHPRDHPPWPPLSLCWRLVVCGAATNRFLRKSGTWSAGAKGVAGCSGKLEPKTACSREWIQSSSHPDFPWRRYRRWPRSWSRHQRFH